MFSYKFYPSPENFTPSRMVIFCKSGSTGSFNDTRQKVSPSQPQNRPRKAFSMNLYQQTRTSLGCNGLSCSALGWEAFPVWYIRPPDTGFNWCLTKPSSLQLPKASKPWINPFRCLQRRGKYKWLENVRRKIQFTLIKHFLVSWYYHGIKYIQEMQFFLWT